MHFSDVECGKRLFVGVGRPIALGIGGNEIRGSAYIEGPIQTGTADAFSSVLGTVMIARDKNTDNKNQPPRSLWVKGNTRLEGDGGTPNALNITGNTVQIGNTDTTGNLTIKGNTSQTGTITAGGVVTGSDCKTAGGITLSSRKPFDIPHPTKKGWRLRHVCIEGPEAGVYFRGKLKNDKIIPLPEYWKKLVDVDTITVQLQPIGAHQDIIVRRWDAEKIELQSKSSIPIHCFYHVYGERQDGEYLISEYKGDSVDDYPGDNSLYSINK